VSLFGIVSCFTGFGAARQGDIDTVCIVFIRTVLRHVSAIIWGYFEVALKKSEENTQTCSALCFKHSRR